MMNSDIPSTVLSVRELQTHFDGPDGPIKAVDGVSFELRRRETLAVVGESGSGKSVMSLSIMGLISHPGRIVGGDIDFIDPDTEHVHALTKLSKRQYRQIRGKRLAMIFQEPATSLNPLFTVGEQIAEMVRVHTPGISRAQTMRTAREMLEKVEIPDAANRVGDYPHHMSGGMRQRVMIAMALACNPAILIADEPTTALDVSIQAQIIELLQRLKADMAMSVLFVSHNLAVVAELADRIAVMYAGQIVETGDVFSVLSAPRHPYTRALLACTPRLRGGARVGRQRLYSIPGSVPSLSDLPPGCNFAPRCELAVAACTSRTPEMTVVGESAVRCIRSGES